MTDWTNIWQKEQIKRRFHFLQFYCNRVLELEIIILAGNAKYYRNVSDNEKAAEVCRLLLFSLQILT